MPPNDLGTIADGGRASQKGRTKLTPTVLKQHEDDTSSSAVGSGLFSYHVDFEIAGESQIAASIGFNSLVSGFQLDLYERSEYGLFSRGNAEISPASAESSR